MTLPNTNTEGDLSILDQLEAADPGIPQEPTVDDPLQHVSEDDLLNIDSLVIQMPVAQEASAKASSIATEAIRIRKSRRIHALEAEQLAQMVPAIQGTPENPVSYTSVPTSVGVDHAVEVLEAGAADAITIATNKASDCIDRVMHAVPSMQTKFERDLVATSGSYVAARAACQEATGGLPESNYGMYLGEHPAPRALGAVAGSNSYEKLGKSLGTYAKRLEPLVGTAFDAYDLFRTPLCIGIGEWFYSVEELSNGEITVQRRCSNDTNITFATSLLAPVNVYPEVAKKLQHGISAALEQVSAIKVEMDGLEHDEVGSVAQQHGRITKAALLITLIHAMEAKLKTIIALTEAATKFYEDCAAGGVVAAAEKQMEPTRVKRRFF